jgi:pyridoxamine 5'-phosphate oxidase
MDPIKLFTKWYQEEQHLCNIKIPSACCFSTNGLDGYPNARFVSLKEVLDGRFIITGPVSSRKGREILKSTKTSLSFWWTVTERQVRIQGDATKISDQHADNYFNERSRNHSLFHLSANKE